MVTKCEAMDRGDTKKGKEVELPPAREGSEHDAHGGSLSRGLEA